MRGAPSDDEFASRAVGVARIRKKKTREIAVPSEPALAPFRSRELQELWLRLAAEEWSSLVVIPASPEGSTVDLACSLADIGSTLSDHAVTAVTVTEIAPGSARALAALADDVRRRQKRLKDGHIIDGGADVPEDPDANAIIGSAGRIIIGVPSVVATPVSLAVAQAADLIILGVEMGRTRTKDVKRSIELVGRERVAGCVLL